MTCREQKGQDRLWSTSQPGDTATRIFQTDFMRTMGLA